MATNPLVNVWCKNLEVFADPTNSFIPLFQTLTRHVDQFIRRNRLSPDLGSQFLNGIIRGHVEGQAVGVTISLNLFLRSSGTALLAGGRITLGLPPRT